MLSWDVRNPFEAPMSLTCLVTPYFTAKQILLQEKKPGQDSLQRGKHADAAEGWQTVILSTLEEDSFNALVKGLARRAMYAASGGTKNMETTARRMAAQSTVSPLKKPIIFSFIEIPPIDGLAFPRFHAGS